LVLLPGLWPMTVPLTYFIDKPVLNWTCQSTEQTCSISLRATVSGVELPTALAGEPMTWEVRGASGVDEQEGIRPARGLAGHSVWPSACRGRLEPRTVSRRLCRGVSSLYCAYKKAAHKATYRNFTPLQSRGGDGVQPHGAGGAYRELSKIHVRGVQSIRLPASQKTLVRPLENRRLYVFLISHFDLTRLRLLTNDLLPTLGSSIR
jgi:hypothetical protein